MSDAVVQAKYEELDALARRFGQRAQANQELQRRIRRNVDALRNGGWQGRGSAAFLGEMDGKIFPGLKRLGEALEKARSTTLELKAILQQAEEEAARVFQGNGAVPVAANKSSWWSKYGEWVHGGLDGLGLVPGLGEVADGVNALIYLAEGRRLEAGLSAAAMLPFGGWGATAGKWGLKGVKEGAEALAERAAKEGAEELAERSVQDQARNAAEKYIKEQSMRGIGVRGHAAEKSAAVIAGPDAKLLDDAAQQVGGFKGNYAPGYDISSSKEISSVKTHWSDANWNETTRGLTQSSLNAYRRDFEKMLGWDYVGKLDDQAAGMIRLRDSGVPMPDVLKNASQADVARYLRDQSVLRVPDDHIGPVREMLKHRIQEFPGNFHLPDNVSESAINDYVTRRIKGAGVSSGDLRNLLAP
jgi:WXG100 family type VII secretion target